MVWQPNMVILYNKHTGLWLSTGPISIQHYFLQAIFSRFHDTLKFSIVLGRYGHHAGALPNPSASQFSHYLCFCCALNAPACCLLCYTVPWHNCKNVCATNNCTWCEEGCFFTYFAPLPIRRDLLAGTDNMDQQLPSSTFYFLNTRLWDSWKRGNDS